MLFGGDCCKAFCTSPAQGADVVLCCPQCKRATQAKRGQPNENAKANPPQTKTTKETRKGKQHASFDSWGDLPAYLKSNNKAEQLWLDYTYQNEELLCFWFVAGMLMKCQRLVVDVH
jgi:hypothetical protein